MSVGEVNIVLFKVATAYTLLLHVLLFFTRSCRLTEWFLGVVEAPYPYVSFVSLWAQMMLVHVQK